MPETFASYAPALVEAGASFLGGYCGTNLAFIRGTNQKMRLDSKPGR